MVSKRVRTGFFALIHSSVLFSAVFYTVALSRVIYYSLRVATSDWQVAKMMLIKSFIVVSYFTALGCSSLSRMFGKETETYKRDLLALASLLLVNHQPPLFLNRLVELAGVYDLAVLAKAQLYFTDPVHMLHDCNKKATTFDQIF